MKDKFNFIYETVKSSMQKLEKKEMTVDEAKAMSALAKQANNVLSTQLDTAKFMSTTNDNLILLADVGM